MSRTYYSLSELGAALFGHEKYQLRCHFELPIGCLQASVIAYFLLLKVKWVRLFSVTKKSLTNNVNSVS